MLHVAKRLFLIMLVKGGQEYYLVLLCNNVSCKIEFEITLFDSLVWFTAYMTP